MVKTFENRRAFALASPEVEQEHSLDELEFKYIGVTVGIGAVTLITVLVIRALMARAREQGEIRAEGEQVVRENIRRGVYQPTVTYEGLQELRKRTGT